MECGAGDSTATCCCGVRCRAQVVAGGGDVNGDGLPDVVIGATQASKNPSVSTPQGRSTRPTWHHASAAAYVKRRIILVQWCIAMEIWQRRDGGELRSSKPPPLASPPLHAACGAWSTSGADRTIHRVVVSTVCLPRAQVL